jgi:hypothetical protein
VKARQMGKNPKGLHDIVGPDDSNTTLLDFLARYATEKIAEKYKMKEREYPSDLSSGEYPTNIVRRREYMKELQKALNSLGSEITNYDELVTDITASGHDVKSTTFSHDLNNQDPTYQDQEVTDKDLGEVGLNPDEIRQDRETEYNEIGGYDELAPTIQTKTRKSKKRK